MASPIESGQAGTLNKSEMALFQGAGLQDEATIEWIKSVKAATTKWRKESTTNEISPRLAAYDVLIVHAMALDMLLRNASTISNRVFQRKLSQIWPAAGAVLFELIELSKKDEPDMHKYLVPIHNEYRQAETPEQQMSVISKILNIDHHGRWIDKYIGGFPTEGFEPKNKWTGEQIAHADFMYKLSHLGDWDKPALE